jgi:outer membrane protein insertion porin family
MKRSICALAFALIVATAFGQDAATDWFWGKPIAGIEWAGVQHADKKELDATVRPFVGKLFTDEVWSDLQAQVYALDWFDTIEPAAYPADAGKTKVLVKFVVKEKPSVSSLRVAGNSGLRTTEVLDVVQEKVGDIYSAAKMKLDELAVKKLYLDKGYPDAQVSSSSADSGSGLAVTFTVSEGSQVAIKEIHFQGNAAFSEQALRGQLDLKPVGFLQNGAFQEAKIESDKQKVVSYYTARGYVDAAVVDVQRKLSQDPKNGKHYLVLTFVIDEGKKWLYGGVSFEGNVIFPTGKLESFFTQKPGVVLNASRFARDKQALDDLYYENGYIFNTITLSESRDTAKMSISYAIKIVERDRAHIESISFKGNKRTKDYVLARELPLQVGDIFSKAKIIEGLRNLYNLQYFSSIEPQLLPGSDENLMDLVFSVEEQSTADVQFGVTLSGLGSTSTSFPLSGLVKWNEKNFAGRGQTIGVELNASPTDQTLTLSFLDNWLFGKRLAGGLDLSFAHKYLSTTQDILDPIFDTGVPDPYGSLTEYTNSTTSMASAYKMPYEYWSLTLGASGGYSMHTPVGDLGLGLGYASTLSATLYDATKYRPASADVRAEANALLWTNKLPFRLYLNDLDLSSNPSSGFYASERFTVAGLLPSPIEAEHFLRSDSRLDYYLTLFNIPVFEGWNWKWVLATHSTFSAIMNEPWRSGDPQVLSADDLRIDGTFVGRGWSTLDYVDDGRILWDNSLELRMPILEQYFWLDGFLDVDALETSSGMLTIGDSSYSNSSGSTFKDLAWNNLVMSAGFGVRFTITQFPFRFYFAKRFSFDGVNFDSTPAGSTSGLNFVISMSQALN